MKSSPGSYVGLLGVDQSVLLLKSGNDIELSDVLKEQEKFNTIEQGNDGDKTFNDFKNSDAFVITNAKKEFKGKPDYNPVYWRSGGLFKNQFSSRGFGGSSASAAFTSQSFGSQDGDRIKMLSAPVENEQYARRRYKGARLDARVAPKVEVRKVFPETWIFDSFDMPMK